MILEDRNLIVGISKDHPCGPKNLKKHKFRMIVNIRNSQIFLQAFTPLLAVPYLQQEHITGTGALPAHDCCIDRSAPDHAIPLRHYSSISPSQSDKPFLELRNSAGVTEYKHVINGKMRISYAAGGHLQAALKEGLIHFLKMGPGKCGYEAARALNMGGLRVAKPLGGGSICLPQRLAVRACRQSDFEGIGKHVLHRVTDKIIHAKEGALNGFVLADAVLYAVSPQDDSNKYTLVSVLKSPSACHDLQKFSLQEMENKVLECMMYIKI
jgi:hypothetical protein